MLSRACSGLAYWFRSVPVKVPDVDLPLLGPWLGVDPAKVSGSDLLPQNFPGLDAPRCAGDLAQAYSLRGSRFTLGTAEISHSYLLPLLSQTNAQIHRGPVSDLLPLRSQTHTWTCRDLWLKPSSLEVLDSCPDPQEFWL